ncbi:MAG: 5-formyltetrahydrofolate cyclo-ligase [Rikenellaceae bacterium]|jgi:5-formyltetrahydrofolate cyclo-ligase|nr:5-formyltetrahydrofolate cyclo-ligase [Rikenellaceae bacterium]
MSKAALRARVRELFAAAVPADLARRSEEIFAEVERTEFFRRARTVALYHALPDEPQTKLFIEKHRTDKQIVLPYVEGENMIFRRLTGRLRSGAFGIAEPTGEEVTDIDLFVVPGVAFDMQNRRLGRGRGYYDRFFAAAAHATTAAAHAAAATSVHPATADAANHAIVTRPETAAIAANHAVAAHPAKDATAVPRIGVCFAFQMFPTIACEPHDQPMTLIINR